MVRTALCPGILLWSAKDLKIILIELTVSWVEGHDEVLKYQRTKDRRPACSLWKKCKGFPAKSTWRLLSALGLNEKSKKHAAQRMGREAEHASAGIGTKREEESWTGQ